MSYNGTAAAVAGFIQSASKKMEENGYTIISSDTNGQGTHGDKIFVTPISVRIILSFDFSISDFVSCESS